MSVGPPPASFTVWDTHEEAADLFVYQHPLSIEADRLI